MTAAFALLGFLIVGSAVLAVCAALNARADDRLAEWGDAERAHDDANGAW